MKNLFLAIILMFAIPAFGQQDKVEILKPIKALFDGMRAADSVAVKSCFVEGASMHSTFTDKDGKKQLREGNLDKFASAVGTPHDEVWDEQIFSYRVEQDGTLATVWTDFTFYLGDQLSHCGVNAFHVVDTEEGWKILSITDTRRKTDCQEKIENK